MFSHGCTEASVRDQFATHLLRLRSERRQSARAHADLAPGKEGGLSRLAEVSPGVEDAVDRVRPILSRQNGIGGVPLKRVSYFSVAAFTINFEELTYRLFAWFWL